MRHYAPTADFAGGGQAVPSGMKPESDSTTVGIGGPDKRRVLVVDDHPLVCAGLAGLINKQKDLVCCGQACTSAAAEHAAATLRPDLVVLDLSLGTEDGLALMPVLHRRRPDLRILILSVADETSHAELALRAGARGYLMKEQATEEMLVAIRMVLAGQVYLSPKIRTQVMHRLFADHAGPFNVQPLTAETSKTGP
jgi:DNA-binding NarL/FixJ family response regulator